MFDDKKKDTYTVTAHCSNCGRSTTITKEKGTPFGGFEACSHCGCRTLSNIGAPSRPTWSREKWQYMNDRNDDAAFGNFNGTLHGNDMPQQS